MKLAIMQPYFFPYIGYFQMIYAADRFVFYDDVNFIKKGWISRNRLLVVNGDPLYFIIPVINKSSNRKIRDIELSYNKPWQKQMLNVIFFNYKKAPFFNDIYQLIEKIINSEMRYLTEFNIMGIMVISKYLDIQTEIITDNSKYKLLEEKLAAPDDKLIESFNFINLDTPIRKLIRVLEICRKEEVDEYINLMGGQELYDKSVFARHGIKLAFIKTNDIVYPQLSNGFYPNLSIIDVLMNCGKEGTKKLIKQFHLV
jgi:hypothetical protein